MALADGGTDLSQRFRPAILSPLLLALAGLWLLLTGMEIARPHYFLHDDNATSFIGMYAHDYRVLTQTGRVAEVNYFQYGGEPFLEQGQTAVLYPPIYVGVALAELSGDVRWAIDWLAAMHLTLGLLGFYCWLRAGGVGAGLAALGGLAWVLNPFVLLVASSWIMVTYAAAWLPWLFWALDRFQARPSRGAAIGLGAIAGLFFLQGYVQWVVYALLFLGLYGLFGLVRKEGARPVNRLVALYYLVVAVLVFLALALPLEVPMSHAAEVSNARAQPIEVGHALFFRVTRHDLWNAQWCLFQPRFVFQMSTAILYCPALLLVPVMFVRFFQAGAAIRSKLFPLVLLALLAVLLSSRWHVLLTMLPVMDRFRWPFKMFLLADFFLIASAVWTAFSWTVDGAIRSRRGLIVAITCVGVVVAAELAVSLGFHDANFFSPSNLPSAQSPLPAGVEPGLGRVIAIADDVPELDGSRYLIAGHATFFEVPSLGGYNPLVSPERLQFALGLDFPNVYRGAITPEVRAQLEARSVRYWLVDPLSTRMQPLGGLIPGMRLLAADRGRLLFEDKQALPLAFSASDPAKACDVAYAGNSIRISLRDAISPLQVSLGPTDGWWYRIDRGAWRKPVYQADHVTLDFAPGSGELEISYFDPRFRAGLRWSMLLLALLAILLFAEKRIRKP